MAEHAPPEVLAAPIVRRVGPRACSVWVAQRDPSDAVKPTVWRQLARSLPAPALRLRRPVVPAPGPRAARR